MNYICDFETLYIILHIRLIIFRKELTGYYFISTYNVPFHKAMFSIICLFRGLPTQNSMNVQPQSFMNFSTDEHSINKRTHKKMLQWLVWTVCIINYTNGILLKFSLEYYFSSSLNFGLWSVQKKWWFYSFQNLLQL